MDRRIVGDKTLLSCVVEVSTMVDGGLLGRTATEDLWFPGIKVRVEVKDSDWAICCGDAAEERQRDGVITSEGNQSWQSLAFGRKANLLA